MFVRRLNLQYAEQLIPIGFKGLKSPVGISFIKIFRDDRFYAALVDRLLIRGIELLILRIFIITQYKCDLLLFAGFE